MIRITELLLNWQTFPGKSLSTVPIKSFPVCVCRADKQVVVASKYFRSVDGAEDSRLIHDDSSLSHMAHFTTVSKTLTL